MLRPLNGKLSWPALACEGLRELTGCPSASSMGGEQGEHGSRAVKGHKHPLVRGGGGAKVSVPPPQPHGEETLPGQSRARLRAGGAPRTPSPGQAALPSRDPQPDPNGGLLPTKTIRKTRHAKGTEAASPGGPAHSPAPSGSGPPALPPWPGPPTPNFGSRPSPAVRSRPAPPICRQPCQSGAGQQLPAAIGCRAGVGPGPANGPSPSEAQGSEEAGGRKEPASAAHFGQGGGGASLRRMRKEASPSHQPPIPSRAHGASKSSPVIGRLPEGTK